MIYDVAYDKAAKREATAWLEANEKYTSKYWEIIDELHKHPRSGIGRPEALRGGKGVFWSRRLNKKDRIVYKILDGIVTVLVLQVGGHYYDT